jgi:hypothetical protein
MQEFLKEYEKMSTEDKLAFLLKAMTINSDKHEQSHVPIQEKVPSLVKFMIILFIQAKART